MILAWFALTRTRKTWFNAREGQGMADRSTTTLTHGRVELPLVAVCERCTAELVLDVSPRSSAPSGDRPTGVMWALNRKEPLEMANKKAAKKTAAKSTKKKPAGKKPAAKKSPKARAAKPAAKKSTAKRQSKAAPSAGTSAST